MSTPEPSIVHFAAITDSRFIVPTLVMATSAKENMEPWSHYHFHLFHDGLASWEIEAVKKLTDERFQVTVHKVDSNCRYAKFPRKNNISNVALARMEFPELLPDLERILYLDGDIVVQADLTKLYEVDLGDNLIAGVEDMRAHTLTPYINEFPGKDFVNSGVLVMNLSQMRQEDLTRKFFETKESAPSHWRYQDQDTINFCCADRMLLLPPKFNGLLKIFRGILQREGLESFNSHYGTSYQSAEELENDLAIIHLAGTQNMRPWEVKEGFYSHQWMHYFMLSPVKHLALKLREEKSEKQPSAVNINKGPSFDQQAFQGKLDRLQNDLSQIKDGVAAKELSNQTVSYGFCSFLPLLTIRSESTRDGRIKKYVKLMNTIPILSAKGTKSRLNWRLFHFIPIWQIRVEY